MVDVVRTTGLMTGEELVVFKDVELETGVEDVKSKLEDIMFGVENIEEMGKVEEMRFCVELSRDGNIVELVV